MSYATWTGLAGTILVLAGCNEIVTEDRRAAAVDVIGEPADATADRGTQTEIHGFDLAPPDITDVSPGLSSQNGVASELDDAIEKTDEPDINDPPRTVTPVNLETENTKRGTRK